MTEIFICALSTSQAELNDEDLQYYRDTKNKQINQVRQCLDFLCAFSALSKKQKMQADLQIIWKSMTILSRILGYEADFCKINKLNLPENLFIHQLLFCNNLFTKKSCRPRQLITHWQSENDEYVVLLSGVVEREVTRTSILQTQFQNLSTSDFGRFRKNMRKRFTRSQNQMPICLNSKRNQVRYGEICSGNFRSVTCSQVFQVKLPFWKKYIEKFNQIQEDYLMNFIRKTLSINLNLQLHSKKHLTNHAEVKQKDELKASNLYSIETYDRKATLELTNKYIHILYIGQMLVQSANYKVEMSKGCILNSRIYQYLCVNGDQTVHLATATAKTECIVIKIRMDLFNSFLQIEQNDFLALTQNLQDLQNNRRNNRQDSKGLTICMSGFSSLNKLKAKRERNSTVQPMSLHEKQNIKQLFLNTKNRKFLPNTKNLLKEPTKNQSQSKFVSASKLIFEWQQIQNRISKQKKVVELKEVQYSKRKMKTEGIHPLEKQLLSTSSLLNQQYSIYNSAIFKNCMSRIQNHSKLLAKAVQETRRKKVDEYSTHEQSIVSFKQKQKNSKDISVKLIKQKMKEIYMKTSQNEQILPYISEKSVNNHQLLQSLMFGTATPPLKTQSPYIAQVFDQPTKRGILKKVKRGQVRRVKGK